MRFFLIQPLKSRQRNNNIFWVVLFVLLLAASHFIDPRDVSFLSCQFKHSTGYNCPTCGLSRSFYAVANLNISDAFGYHLLGPFLYLWIAVFYVKSLTEVIFKKKIILDVDPFYKKTFIILFAGIWFFLWLSNFYPG